MCLETWCKEVFRKCFISKHTFYSVLLCLKAKYVTCLKSVTAGRLEIQIYSAAVLNSFSFQDDGGGRKKENGEEKKENRKREGEKLKMEGGKVTKWGENPFFFFFFFFLFHFSKPLKFVLGLPKWEFSTGKKTFHAWKKSGKMNLPLSKIFLLRPWGVQTRGQKEGVGGGWIVDL